MMREPMTQTASELSGNPTRIFSKHRIEALSDGLFAIVMTLLVLELRVPELPHGASNSEIVHALRPLLRPLFSFALTFSLASIFWMLQHSIYLGTRALDRISVGMHLAAMLFVSLLPFSTAMLGHYGSQPVAQVLYFGNQGIIAGLLCLTWIRERRAGNTEASEYEAKLITARTVSMFSVCAGAVVVGAINPQWVFFGVLPGVIGTRIYRRRLKKQA